MADRRIKLKTRSLERGKSAPLIVVTQNEDGKASDKKDPSVAGLKMGHDFKKRTFYKPTYCHHCSEMLWGIMNQGFQCSVCNYVTHEKCIPFIMVDCLHLKAESIVEHVPHQWTGPETKKKKKWCNMCRRKINGSIYYCSVCRIYSHDRCKNESFNDCKRCAIHSRISNPKFHHHWIEGNLPTSSKCEVCQKSCSTDLCLFGFRCGWCGITVHSNCLDGFTLNPRNERCTFRDTRFMILPPTAVSLPFKEVETGEEVVVEDMSQLFSPVSSEDKVPGEDESDMKGRPAVIIDGSSGSEGYKKWRKRTLQSIFIPKKMQTRELLFIALRKFGISADPDDYFLSETPHSVSSASNDKVLEPNSLPYNLQQNYHGPLKIYIRKKQTKANFEHKLKVYNSNLSSTLPYVECDIDSKMTFADVVVKCIQLFELEDKSTANYCIYESSLDLCETVVNLADRPSKRIDELTQDSLWTHSSLRFYLCPKEVTVIEMCLWKVPVDHLKTREAATEFVRNLMDGATFELGSIYSNQGSLIVKLQTLQDAQQLMSKYRSTKAIPNIHKEVLQSHQEPLLVFVNTKSGGQQGVKLINGFRRHLNPHQVYDLMNGGPVPGLYAFRNVPKYRILVAGGDGTVGWVLGALDDLKSHLVHPNPPCGVIPLGTGNDLARALKWGGGYTGEKVMQLLYAVEDSNVVEFDRWSVNMSDPLDGLVDETMSGSKCIIMNNYLGVGLDAEIALDFHQAREENPEKFNSRFHNKGVYLQLGMQKTFSRDSTADLSTQISLEVDGKEISLSPGLKGVVVLNIASWGAGSEPWGSNADQEFQKCCFNDGKIEIMGLNGPVHLGQIKSGIRGGIRLAQGSEVCISLQNTLPVQVDGEAWSQAAPVKIIIQKLESKTLMLVKSSQDHYSRGISHGEARSLLSNQPILSSDGTQMSSRRPRVLNSPSSQPSIGVSTTRTLYIKDNSNKK